MRVAAARLPADAGDNEPRDIIKPRRCAERHLEILGEDLRDDDRVALREVREPTRIAIDKVTTATTAERRAA